MKKILFVLSTLFVIACGNNKVETSVELPNDSIEVVDSAIADSAIVDTTLIDSMIVAE